MIAIICATLAGITIVLSRSINGLLSQRVGAYQSTFYNYFTGFITSFLVMLCIGMPYLNEIKIPDINNPFIYVGGIIGVFNILILNIIVPKVSPIQLTLITFVAQLISGMVLDYYFYQMFSTQKIIGCLIVVIGLIIYQLAEKQDSLLDS
ncbi:MAG: DMT family transporter [Coprobacillus sp.]